MYFDCKTLYAVQLRNFSIRLFMLHDASQIQIGNYSLIDFVGKQEVCSRDVVKCMNRNPSWSERVCVCMYIFSSDGELLISLFAHQQRNQS